MGSRRRFRGWVVVAALGTVLATSVGISFYGVSVYLAALTRGPGAFSLGAVSLATSAFLLVGGIAGLGVAALLERVDIRWVLCGGALAGGAALYEVGTVRTPAQLTLAYAALGVGFAATGAIPASAVIARWFVRRRALAMSLAFTGLPVGGAVLTPPIAALVHSLGVAGAAPWLAAAYVVGIVPVTLAFIRPGPEAAGSGPDGDSAPQTPAAGHDSGAVREAVRTPWFWVITTALMLGMLGQVGAQAHVFNAIAERLDTVAATAAVSAMAVASLVGRMLGSALLGRVRLTTATAALLGIQCLATLGIATSPSPATVVGCTVAFGLTVGNVQVLHPLLIAERFGGASYARILALSNLVVCGGMAFGPLAVGAVRSGTGSYLGGMAVAACSATAGAIVVLFAARSARRAVSTPIAASEAYLTSISPVPPLG